MYKFQKTKEPKSITEWKRKFKNINNREAQYDDLVSNKNTIKIQNEKASTHYRQLLIGEQKNIAGKR